jgi:hypothetical protein
MMGLLKQISELEVRQRVFQWVCLSVGLCTLFVIVPMRLLEHPSISWVMASAAIGCVFLILWHVAYARNLYLYKTSTVFGILLLNVAWYFTSGSQGPVPLVFLCSSLMLTIYLDQRVRWYFAGFILFNILGLFFLEVMYPNFVAPFPNAALRLRVIVISVPITLLVCVSMVRTIMDAYESERLQLQESKAELEAKLAEIRVLKGMLPICASCKKIRTKNGEWTQMERYITEHSNASFSHGLCPECMPLFMNSEV